MRPDAVWFGEEPEAGTLKRALKAVRAAGVCIVTGMSAVAQARSGHSLGDLECGGAIIEVNPEPIPLTYLPIYSLRGSGADLSADVKG